MAREQFITTSEAGKILGVSEDLFEDLAEKEGWIRPIMLSRKAKRWLRKDVLCLAHILARRSAERPPEKGPAGV